MYRQEIPRETCGAPRRLPFRTKYCLHRARGGAAGFWGKVTGPLEEQSGGVTVCDKVYPDVVTVSSLLSGIRVSLCCWVTFLGGD